jgi:choline dehydrogenase
MLSGIGPAAHLAEHGIRWWPTGPAWARTCRTIWRSTSRCARSSRSRSIRYWNLAGQGAGRRAWLLTGGGPGASNQFEACGFIRSRAGVDYPDIQFHFLPLAVRYDGRRRPRGTASRPMSGRCGRSRGARCGCARPIPEPPSIRFNYMSHPEDWEEFRRAASG